MRTTRAAVLALAIGSIGCTQSHAPDGCGYACEPCCAHDTCFGSVCAAGYCVAGIPCDSGPWLDVGPRPDTGPPTCGGWCQPCCPGDRCVGGLCIGGNCVSGIACGVFEAGVSDDASAASDAGASEDDAQARADAGSTCAQVDALDRGCATDADCVSAIHAADCCGTYAAIGFASSEADDYARLEPLCDASYPPCGCAARPTTTDSGEMVSSPSDVRVACVTRGTGAVCLTYVAMRPPNDEACGRNCQPCCGGSACLSPFSCSAAGTCRGGAPCDAGS